VHEIHREGDALVVKRLSDGFLETVRVVLPVLMTVSQELCPPKDLSLGALEVAFSEENIAVWGCEELGLKMEEVGMAGSATQVWRLHRPPPRKEGELISGTPEKLVAKFISKLEALSLLEEEDDRG
jgi:electron transfer flavoprotein beta subunit